MDGYEPQLSPSQSSDYSGAPQDWGGGLTRGLEEAGASVDSAIHQVKQKDRDAQATQAGVDFAQNSAALDQQAIALRQQAGPGGAGHTQNINAAIDQTSADALGRIRDPHIRQAFQERYAQLKGQLATREYGWQAGQYVNKLATDFDQQGDIAADHLASSGDIHALPNALAGIQVTGNALALDDDTKTKLVREQQRKVVLGYANAAVRMSPGDLLGDGTDSNKGLLGDSRFTQYLKPGDIDALRDKAETEQRRQAAEQRQAANQAKAAQISKNSVMEYRVNELGYEPTAAELEDYIHSNQQLGLTKDALQFVDIKDKASINQQYRTAPPIQWHNDINALQQKVTDGKATDADRMHLKNLIDLSGPAIAKFNADPYSFAAQGPNPAPAIDWSTADPAALRTQGAQRVAWARPFAATNGIVDPASIYLSPDDKKIFTDGLKSGATGQVETLQKLQMAFGPSVTASIARSLVPGDKNLELMAGLNDRGMQLFKTGTAGLSAGTVRLGAESGDDAVADRGIKDSVLSFYANGIPPDMLPAVKQAAEGIAAGVALENHSHYLSGQDLQNVYSQAIQRVAGMRGSVANGTATGGFANWWGNNRVWLPPDMSRTDFQQRMSRAGKADWVKAGGGVPCYVGPNGKAVPLSDQQIAQLNGPHYSLAPVRAGTGDYYLVGPGGGKVMQKDGRTPFQFNIRNLR